LVDDLILVLCHNLESFVRSLVCEWPLNARASHTPLSRLTGLEPEQ
jgi:hypothetical protein